MQGILIVDKPMDWTSFDVIAKLRGILGTRKLGHSGTLDPMATGVLPVFCGGASKAVDLQLDHDQGLPRPCCGWAMQHRHRRHHRHRAGNGPGDGRGAGAAGRAAAVRRPPDADAAHVLGGQGQRPAPLQAGPRGHRRWSGRPAPSRSWTSGTAAARRRTNTSCTVTLLQGHLYPHSAGGHCRRYGPEGHHERSAPH